MVISIYIDAALTSPAACSRVTGPVKAAAQKSGQKIVAVRVNLY